MLSITAGAGPLMELAVVEVIIAGIKLTLRGVWFVRCTDRRVLVAHPTVRDEQRRGIPILDMPAEVMSAIDLAVRREVMETVAERIAARALMNTNPSRGLRV
jgi:hypothetical protein